MSSGHCLHLAMVSPWSANVKGSHAVLTTGPSVIHSHAAGDIGRKECLFSNFFDPAAVPWLKGDEVKLKEA